jgi:NodT family efflux transporter outer membrane factor (OMF) lipoprotein
VKTAGSLFLLFSAFLMNAGCGAARQYERPAPPEPPPAFKENWQPARPADQALRGAWWDAFQDPQLSALETQIEVSNETLRAQQARFEQARAAIGIRRADRYPQVSSSPSISGGEASGNRQNATSHQSSSSFVLPVDVAYEADAWGRIRANIESARAGAQASAADLEFVRLSLHTELALDYFELRGLDAEKATLDAAVGAFERALDLTRSRFTGGIASQADVAQAETQLESTRAQAVDLGVRRAALEHAIAVLIGRPAASFSLEAAPLSLPPPDIPPGLPSELLERRPDIAGAERRVASANADVGVANAAFFPRLFLTATAGFESTSLRSWLTGLSTFWSAGPAAAQALFDAGRRRAVRAQAQAAYDASAADYRNTILTAFQEVEDNLAALRLLQQEAEIQAAAVAAADRSLTLATNRYRGGVASYLEVITAQSASLASQRTAVQILSRRLAASVLLIKALGGGWNAAALPALRTEAR